MGGGGVGGEVAATLKVNHCKPALTVTGSREFSRSMTGSSVVSEAILNLVNHCIPALTATGSREFSRSMTGSSVISEAILRAICSMSSPSSCGGASSCFVLGKGGKAGNNNKIP